LYAFETWFVTLGVETETENRLLRRIFGPKKREEGYILEDGKNYIVRY
jgi:hypothetical protein